MLITFTAPTTVSEPRKNVLGNFVRRIKKDNWPAFASCNLLINGFTFSGFVDIKRIDLSTVWLLVEVIVPTVLVLYVFSTASLRSESIVVTNLHWAVKKTITVILF